MARRRPLPSALTQVLFSVEEGLGAGASPGQLRHSGLERSVWGVRSSEPVADLHGLCSLFAARLGGTAFFCHRTAALLHGLPVPPSRSALIDVALPVPDRAPHAQGLRGHSIAVAPDDVEMFRGLRVTSAPRTWFDLGKLLLLPDLVAAGDRILSARAPLAGRGELEAIVEAHPGERGVRRLVAALDLLSDRSESPQESRLRALLVTAGIPAPAVNLDIRDDRGVFLGRGDLVWVQQRLVIEYQGDYHRDQAQWRADMTRRAGLEAAGWRVLEVNADDLRNPATLIERVRTLLLH
jgi:hypothetical protein